MTDTVEPDEPDPIVEMMVANHKNIADSIRNVGLVLPDLAADQVEAIVRDLTAAEYIVQEVSMGRWQGKISPGGEHDAIGVVFQELRKLRASAEDA